MIEYHTPAPVYLACSQYNQKPLRSLSWLTFLSNLLTAKISYHLQCAPFHKDTEQCLKNAAKEERSQEMCTYPSGPIGLVTLVHAQNPVSRTK